MGLADWGELSGALGSTDLRRGVTQAFTPPVGGGNFVYGWNSMSGEVTGAHGRYVNLTNFAPMVGGGSIRGAIKRVGGAAVTGFAPLLFFGATSNPPTVNNVAYLLGLEDADPYRIVLRKDVISAGMPAATDSNSLRRSSAQFAASDGLWHHLRLDVIAEPNGDVKLKVFRNVLTGGHDVQNPDWQPVAGMDDFVDDILGSASGSVPLVGGFAGYAFAVSNAISRRGAVDFVELLRAV
jgi:hypothetical protein